MLRMYIFLVSLAVCSNLIGCSGGPSNKEAANLAFSFLSGMIPGITEHEISVLKTVEKGSDTTVLIQAGDMLCKMPVIRRKDGWIASSILCNGQFESPQKAAIRALNSLRADINSEINKLNTSGPYTSKDRNIRYNKAEIDNEAAIYYITLLNTNPKDCTNTLITAKIKTLIDSLCTDGQTKNLLIHDISYEYDTYDGNGNVTSKHVVNKDICNNQLYCQNNQ